MGLSVYGTHLPIIYEPLCRPSAGTLNPRAARNSEQAEEGI
jgi:hypothetical protein